MQDGRVIDVRDPRPRYQRIWCRRQAADLPVPQFKVCLPYRLLFSLFCFSLGGFLGSFKKKFLNLRERRGDRVVVLTCFLFCVVVVLLACFTFPHFLCFCWGQILIR